MTFSPVPAVPPTTISNLPDRLVRRLGPAHPVEGKGKGVTGTGLADISLPGRPKQRTDLMKVLDQLPAAHYVDTMLRLLDKDGCLVVNGETSSGKSTVLPLFTCAHHRNIDVICAVPRVQAAERLAIWLSEVVQQPVGRLVGYHHGTDKQVSKDTKLTFCTTGVAEMRALLGQIPREVIVFLDEAHERNQDQDMLLAFLRQEMERNPLLKVVVMSATIEFERFSEYLGGCKVLSIKGRSHPITQVEPELLLEQDVVKFVGQGLTGQIGLAGKLEIEQATAAIESALDAANLKAIILHLHKDVPSRQQQECFKKHDLPVVILATNYAETSLTIEGLDYVIDCGTRRRTYLSNGVQCLGTVWATQFEAKQLRGRVGRTKPGIAVDRCPVPLADRPVAPAPELLRLQPTNALLKFLAFQKLDPREMELLDDPGVEVWDCAEQELKTLGLVDSEGVATELGQLIARLPISVNLGRMLVAARQRGVLRDAIWVAAAIEINGIEDRESSAWREQLEDLELDSELAVQRRLFEIAQNLHANGVPESEFNERGISHKNFIKASEHAAELMRRGRLMGWEDVDSPPRSKSSVEHALVQSFLEGFPESIFVKRGRYFVGLDGEKRQLHGAAQVSSRTQFVAGIPWDFNPEVESAGGRPRFFINFASPVSESTVAKYEYVRDLLISTKPKRPEHQTQMRAPQSRSIKRRYHGRR